MTKIRINAVSSIGLNSSGDLSQVLRCNGGVDADHPALLFRCGRDSQQERYSRRDRSRFQARICTRQMQSRGIRILKDRMIKVYSCCECILLNWVDSEVFGIVKSWWHWNALLDRGRGAA
jgi:hypothetical protein